MSTTARKSKMFKSKTYAYVGLPKHRMCVTGLNPNRISGLWMNMSQGQILRYSGGGCGGGWARV